MKKYNNVGKQGMWIEIKSNRGYKCSLCKFKVRTQNVVNKMAYIFNRFNFCPRCGAEIVGRIYYNDEFNRSVKEYYN